MKKWLIIEVFVLLVVLTVAVSLCIIPREAFAPSNLSTTTQPKLENPTGDSLPSTPSQGQQGGHPPASSIPGSSIVVEPTWMVLPEGRKLTAKQAFVYDCETGEFAMLLGKANDRVYPASITKLFTAYVALQFLEPTRKITAGDELDLIVPGSSVAEIKKGNVLTVEMLVEAMLLPSGNDAAYILAAEAGRVMKQNTKLSGYYAVQAFMDEMNRQAAALGMTGTHFVNPDGIHESNHYSTFTDLAKMGQLSMQNPTILKYAIVSQEDVVFESGEKKQWKNTNLLVHPESEYFCPYAVGLKTGQTPSAGSCLLSGFDVKGHQYVIGVFGCPDVEDRFADTLQLLNEALGITSGGASVQG